MIDEDAIARLKKGFVERYPHATLAVTSRMVGGEPRYYFKTVGAYKVESGRYIELHFETVYRTKEDYNTLTYHYRTE